MCFADRPPRVACQAAKGNAGSKSRAKQGQAKREEVVKKDVGGATDLQLKKAQAELARPASADDPDAPDVPISGAADTDQPVTFSFDKDQAVAYESAAPLGPGSSNDPDDREVPLDTLVDGSPAVGPLAEARRNPDGSLGGQPGSSPSSSPSPNSSPSSGGPSRDGTVTPGRSSASDEALAELAAARAEVAAARAGDDDEGPAEAAGDAAQDAAQRAEGALDQGVDAAGAFLDP